MSIVTSPKWEELMGSKNWNELLTPELSIALREFILRCADFSQATYDSFVSDPSSPNSGNTRHSIETFFADVASLQKHDKNNNTNNNSRSYFVHSFLYAASGLGDPSRNLLFILPGPSTPDPWDLQSNWMGYVAVTSDQASLALGRRVIYVAWRGTIMSSEWTSNVAGFIQTSAGPLLRAREINNDVRVHQGWYNIYTNESPESIHAKTSARAQLNSTIRELVKRYEKEELSVVVTGHSLGGVLATLSAFDLVENRVVGSDVLVAAVVFGCPQVGNEAFEQRVEAHSNLKILHVKNAGDVVPRFPDSGLPFYVPIATAEMEIQHSGTWNVSRNHSLIVTLEMLNGGLNNGTTVVRQSRL